MKKSFLATFIAGVIAGGSLLVPAVPARAQAVANSSPIHLWFEPEWFEGVSGGFGYWSGNDANGQPNSKPTGAWGIAGPGISAEFTQGGESEWNSMGVPAAETKAECHRAFVVPRAGKYRIWVRYYDHRNKTEPFKVQIEQAGRAPAVGEFGVKPVLPPNDEYQLYWNFAFAWASVDAELAAGPATLKVLVDKAGEEFRQVDAVLITSDLSYTPQMREKPHFSYFDAFKLQPADGAAWRGKDKTAGEGWKRPQVNGRDFAMWVGGRGMSTEKEVKIENLTVPQLLFQSAGPTDIRKEFIAQYKDAEHTPLVNWPGFVPGFYLGEVPDLSPNSPLRQFLEKTKAPFYIMTNYANPNYTAEAGPATYQALTGALKDQFMGYIHGEAMGSLTVHQSVAPTGKTRREFIDAVIADLKKQQEAEWTKFYKTPVSAEHFNKGIACMSCESITFCHAMLEGGRGAVAYELDATNAHTSMRIAFHRGAARQYGKYWINYASSNFGDACNYFTQDPIVPRGARGWWHSKYAITDGVPISWYRQFYYMNFLGGASAIYWEQSLVNQYMKPGPGNHPVQLSPFGRSTEDFQGFVDRLPDRGEPYTPVGVLLSYGHGYERVNNYCKMISAYQEDANDIELRELFSVLWHPSAIRESEPITPEKQSMQPGVYGDIYDVLVDRPGRLAALKNYPVMIAAGDVNLDGPNGKDIENYIEDGGTLVVNIEAAKANKNIARLAGVKLTGEKVASTAWSPDGKARYETTPFEVERIKIEDAKPIVFAEVNGKSDVPLIVRNKNGRGAVILTLVPRMIGLDERAHPAMPYLMNGLTQHILPVEVLHADGSRPSGDVMYSVNRTKDGCLVALYNNDGIDKTQHGIARVDRTKFVDVLIRGGKSIKSAKEFTQPRDLEIAKDGDARTIKVRVTPGDVQVVGLVMD